MSVRQDAAGAASTATPALTEHVVDRVFTLLAGWLMAGVFLDAGAHIQGLPDSFWTPWHGILYSGLIACGAFLVVAKSAERATGRTLLADGYGLSLIGLALAGAGGVGDAIWHTVFGVEFDIEAAVSPSHLAVAFGILLLVSGPARAAWARRSFGLTAALSLLYSLSILTIILDYANPFAGVYGRDGAAAARELAQLQQRAALFAFSLYAALTSGLALIVARRGGAAPLWYALIFGGNAAAMALVNAPLHPDAVGVLLAVAAASAALIALAAALLRPAPHRVPETRAFAFAIPAITYAFYGTAVAVLLGTWWSPTFWTGIVAMGGIVGLLLSAVALPARRA